MIIYFILAYLVVTVFVTTLAADRRISFGTAFIVSLFLTPVLGLFTILKTDKKIIVSHYSNKYRCPRCQSVYTRYNKYCTQCLAEGVKSIPETLNFELAGYFFSTK